MVTSVDNDQRSPAPEAAAASVPEQSPASVVEVLPTASSVPAEAAPTDEPITDPATTPDGDPAAVAPQPAAPTETAARADDSTSALSALLANAEERATSAEATVAALTERLAGLESRAEQAEGAARSLERAVAAADDELEALTTRIAEVAEVAARDRAGTAAIGSDVAELQETVRRIDQDTSIAIAREVERHTTAELVDGQQRLHQASIVMAGLAQSLADAARQITPELTADSARTLIDSFAVDIDLLLQQLGHDAMGVGAGDPFDARRHRALRRIPTTDPAADRTVARVIRDGYRTPATDRVLLFADVEVFRFTDPAPAGPTSGVATGTSSEKGS